MANQNELALMKKNVVDVVSNKVLDLAKEGKFALPENYSIGNAMQAAWLILQETTTSKKDGKNPVLEVCTRDSIANSLFDMGIQGLSPSKKQCYFVPYGKKLTLMRSYFGTAAVVKRLKDVKDVRQMIIYQDDEIEIEILDGTKRISKHITKLENINIDKIKGAYVVIEKADGTQYTEIMNMEQIKKAWGQSSNYPMNNDGSVKPDSVHGKFTDQMALKTVINRACKMFANTSDDSDLLIEAFNNTTANEYKQEETVDDVQAQVTDEIKETEPIVIDIPEEKQTIVEEPEQMDLKGTPFAK